MHEADCRPQVTWLARRLHYLEQEDAQPNMAIAIHPVRVLARLNVLLASGDEQGAWG